jgi:hypothetical protein
MVADIVGVLSRHSALHFGDGLVMPIVMPLNLSSPPFGAHPSAIRV